MNASSTTKGARATKVIRDMHALIVDLMDARKVTANVLADQSGIARTTLGRRLQNPSNLKLSEIEALAGVLDVSPAFLLVGKDVV